ncbi:MAG: hypothetical protein EPO68_14060 [Planctomycetota bacterium]|nr:MAG: hypothetical protein EPO68_14060 [Planctomycetota bacterium]
MSASSTGSGKSHAPSGAHGGAAVAEHPPKHGSGDGHGAKHGEGGHAPGHGGGHDDHGGHGAHGGHGGHKKHDEHGHHGPPPWLISFGDMMTLFLCFFIMLVTMAPTRDAGLMAAGLGSFVSTGLMSGMDGALTGQQRLAAVNMYRQRFGLPPLQELEEENAPKAFGAEEIEELLSSALKPHFELRQPLVARFETGSYELDDRARDYLDLLADTLRPSRGQVLVLEGYARDVKDQPFGRRAWIAASRAQAVRRYLLDEHQLVSTRVEARALADDGATSAAEATGVDARLVTSDL